MNILPISIPIIIFISNQLHTLTRQLAGAIPLVRGEFLWGGEFSKYCRTCNFIFFLLKKQKSIFMLRFASQEVPSIKRGFRGVFFMGS